MLLIIIYLNGRHDWIRTSDLFRVKDVKLRHFNLQDHGGSLSPCKHIKRREPTYCKTYRARVFTGNCCATESFPFVREWRMANRAREGEMPSRPVNQCLCARRQFIRNERAGRLVAFCLWLRSKENPVRSISGAGGSRDQKKGKKNSWLHSCPFW